MEKDDKKKAVPERKKRRLSREGKELARCFLNEQLELLVAGCAPAISIMTVGRESIGYNWQQGVVQVESVSDIRLPIGAGEWLLEFVVSKIRRSFFHSSVIGVERSKLGTNRPRSVNVMIVQQYGAWRFPGDLYWTDGPIIVAAAS